MDLITVGPALLGLLLITEEEDDDVDVGGAGGWAADIISGETPPGTPADGLGGIERIVAPEAPTGAFEPSPLPTLPVAGAYPSIADATAPDGGAERGEGAAAMAAAAC